MQKPLIRQRKTTEQHTAQAVRLLSYTRYPDPNQPLLSQQLNSRPRASNNAAGLDTAVPRPVHHSSAAAGMATVPAAVGTVGYRTLLSEDLRTVVVRNRLDVEALRMTAHRTDLLVVDPVVEAGSFGVAGWEVVRMRALSRRRCVVVAGVADLEEEGMTGLLKADCVRESGRTVCRMLAGYGVVGNRLLRGFGRSWVVLGRCRDRSGLSLSSRSFGPAGYASRQTCPLHRQ